MTVGDVDKVIVGEVSIGEVSIGEVSIGEVSIGEVIETREICLYAAVFVNYN